MTVARASGGESAGVLRWGACLALVLGLHAGLVLALLRRAPRPELQVLAPDAVMLELAPAAAPAMPAVQEAAPQPVAPLPAPEQPPPVEPPPDEPPPQPEPPIVPPPNPAAALPEPSPPPPSAPKRPVPLRSAVRPPPRPAQANPSPPAPQAPASSAAPAPAPLPASTAPPSPSAVPGWLSELVGRLRRAKRYPDTARARDEQGAAAVTFTIDRSGHVLSARLVRSSGSPALDEEAVEMVRRADPLPPMPSELPGSTLTLTVPVTFSLH